MPDLTQALDIIARQEALLIYDSFDADAAWHLGQTLVACAAARERGVTIEIVLADQLRFHFAGDATAPLNADWCRRKARLTRHFSRASLSVALQLQQEGSTLAQRYGLDPGQYAAAGGAFPLRVGSLGCVGSVAVSGLAQREDHALVVQALATCLGREVPHWRPA